MDFNELDSEKKTKLLKLLGGEKLPAIKESFDSEIYQQALHLTFGIIMEGSITMNDKKIFTGYTSVASNAFDKKEREFVNLFGTLINPTTQNIVRSNSFHDDGFIEIYDLYYNDLTNTSVKRGLKILYDIINPSTETPSTTQQTTVGIDTLRQFTKKYDIESPESRIKIYNYWYDIYHNKFLSYEDDLKTIIFPSGVSGKLSDTLLEIHEKMSKVKDNFQGLKIPCYTVNLKSYGKKKQAVDEIAALELANSFLSGNILEGDMKAYTKKFGVEEPDKRGAQQFKDKSKAPVGDMPEIRKPIRQLRKKIDMIEHDIDPLTALSIYSKQDLLMSPESIQKTTQLVYKELENLNLGVLKEIILEDLSDFIDDIKDDIVDRNSNEFNFSILDDSEHVNLMDKIYSDTKFFMYEYYELTSTETSAGQETIFSQKLSEVIEDFKVADLEFAVVSPKLVRKYVNTYGDLVKMINNDTQELLEVIALQIDLQEEVAYLYNDIVSTIKETTSSADSTNYLQGGELPAIPGKEPSFNPNTIFSELFLIIEDYYFNSMDAAFFYGKDSPAFTSSSEYQSMKSVFDSNVNKPISRIKQDLRRYGELNVTENDITDLTKFFRLIRKYSTLELTKSVLIDFNDAYLALINIHMTSTGSTTRRSMQNISNTYANMLGKILFEIVQFKNVSKDEMDKIQFRSKPLSKYANTPTQNIDNIHEILDDKDFIAYAKRKQFVKKLRTLKTEIKTNSTLKIIASGEELKADITTVYVNALDTLKKMKGESIYKGYLHLDDIDDIDYVTNIIRKENNVDIFITDIQGIVESNKSFNTLSKSFGVSQDIIYKIKGLFR